MTPARFDQIKIRTANIDKTKLGELTLLGIGNIVAMLKEVVDELDRRNTPTPARTSGPRAVVLDAQGKPVMPPPIVAQFEGERREQYSIDRHEVLMALDIEKWRVFCLRWGLTPPPGGWDNREAIMNVMHAVRLGVQSIDYIDKHFSAVYLTSKGIALPPGMKLENGVLVGHDAIRPNPR